MLENLKDLIAIDSYLNCDKIIEFLYNKFILKSKDIKVIKNKENENKSLIVGLNTTLKDVEPIVLSGHIDTVAPDLEKYQTNPYELTTSNGKAYGLGSIDMKSFVAIILDNINILKDFSVPIVISLTTDEETDLICIENVISFMKENNIKPRFTIVGEPTNCQVNNQANGCYEFEIKTCGVSCHSSVLNQGINAINVMAKIISFIENEQKNFIGLTSNCGVISGGDIVNRVPDNCTMKFDVRSTNSKQVYDFLNLILNKINQLKEEYKTNIKIKKLLEIPPLENKNEKFIKELANKLNLQISKFSGGCEAGYYQALSGDSIIFGVGDLNLAHKPNEFVVEEEYFKYGKLFINLLKKLEENYLNN